MDTLCHVFLLLMILLRVGVIRYFPGRFSSLVCFFYYLVKKTARKKEKSAKIVAQLGAAVMIQQ